MSASAHSLSRLPRDQELLGDLLHSLSQPLTSLRCSLELSIDEVTEQQQQMVSAALQQTETVIGMIQLMREYLDAEQSAGQHAVALMPVLRSMAEDLSSIAALRNIRLRVVGTCAAKVRVAEPQLRLALQYLILAMIERQPAGSEITLLVAEGPAGAVLRAQSERRFVGPGKTPDNRQSKRDSVGATMRRVRLAIAGRVLETAGAALALDDGAPGFVLRIPRPNAACASHLF
jgi:signal transduction histidine kinase